MTEIERVKALKEMRIKADALMAEIYNLSAENEKEITRNVDEICEQIERDLEEIYELTDKNVIGTRHINFSCETPYGKRTYGLAYEGETLVRYFMDSERTWGNSETRKYHVILGQYSDASGVHWYEDGKWRTNSNAMREIFASNWENIKEQIISNIGKAYEDYQKSGMEKALRRLSETENRLAAVSGKENT